MSASTQVATESDDEKAMYAWRRLAFQFDEHRMQALNHLRAMLADPKAHAYLVTEFLAAPPINGEQVLAERVRSLAATRVCDANDIDLDAAAKKLSECMDYPWTEMPEQGRAHMRTFAQSVVNAALSSQPKDPPC